MNDRLTLPILIAAALVILAVVFAPHVAYADDSETTAEATQVEDTAVIDTYASASIANGTYYFYSAIKNNLALDVNNN
ncbi:MAG: hypothetical protein RR619_09090, partial [Raoultibacter sp.]